MKDEDPKLYAQIWALQNNCPILVLYNNLKLSPGDFLAQVCPLQGKKKPKLDPPDINVFLLQKCGENERIFADRVQVYYMRLVQWITFMNSDNLKDSDQMINNLGFMVQRSKLITIGIKLATEIKRTLKQYLLLYEVNGKAVPQERLPLIIQTIEMLKAIEIEFKTKKFLINKWVVLINRQTCEIITRILEKGLQKIYAMKKGGINQQNLLQLIMTILECYKGGYNAIRKTIVRHCLDLVSAEGIVFDKTQLIELQVQNEVLEDISNWEI